MSRLALVLVPGHSVQSMLARAFCGGQPPPQLALLATANHKTISTGPASLLPFVRLCASREMSSMSVRLLIFAFERPWAPVANAERSEAPRVRPGPRAPAAPARAGCRTSSKHTPSALNRHEFRQLELGAHREPSWSSTRWHALSASALLPCMRLRGATKFDAGCRGWCMPHRPAGTTTASLETARMSSLSSRVWDCAGWRFLPWRAAP
jgi:hypothetical protein